VRANLRTAGTIQGLAPRRVAPAAVPRSDLFQEVERFIRINQPAAALSARLLSRESAALHERNFVIYFHVWQTPFDLSITCCV
jgi:hypothetical protein